MIRPFALSTVVAIYVINNTRLNQKATYGPDPGSVLKTRFDPTDLVSCRTPLVRNAAASLRIQAVLPPEAEMPLSAPA